MEFLQLDRSHALAYKALMLEAYALSADAFTSSVQERIDKSDAWWIQRIADANAQSLTFGAIEGGELVGSARLEFYEPLKNRHKAHLTAVYVKPAWRGKKLGRALVKLVLQQAAQRPGIALVNLSVTEGNTAAQALYVSLGFEVYGTEPMAIRATDSYLAKVLMYQLVGDSAGKRLGDP